MANNSKRGRGKGRRPHKKDDNATKTQNAAVEGNGPDVGPQNDISWYAKYPNLLAAAGTFPYPYRPGMQLPVSTSAAGVNRTMEIPGVLSMTWIPTCGKSSLPTDPASVLGKEIYARVRNCYSGRIYADAPDFVMYILALDSVFSYIAWLKRLYRVLAVWSPENRLVPDRLLKGMGLTDADINKLRTQKTELWQSINELVLQSRKWTCPGGLDIINRHYWMSDNIYTDDATINSQFYMFNLQGVFMYGQVGTDGTDENATPIYGLQGVSLPWMRTVLDGSTDYTLTAGILKNFGLDLMDHLAEWDDSFTINGYLTRAYEGQQLFMVDEEPIVSQFTPVFEPEVLMQIENSMCIPFGSIAGMDGFKITQDVLTNSIVCDNTVKTATTKDDFYGEGKYTTARPTPLITLRSSNPGPVENTIATRLKASASKVTKTTLPNNAGYQYAIECDTGTEIPLCWYLMDGDTSNNSATWMAANAIPSYINYTSGAAPAIGKVMRIMTLSAFDWHPIIRLAWTDGSDTDYGVMGDLHNVTAISQADLENLHRICLFSEFNSFSMS